MLLFRLADSCEMLITILTASSAKRSVCSVKRSLDIGTEHGMPSDADKACEDTIEDFSKQAKHQKGGKTKMITSRRVTRASQSAHDPRTIGHVEDDSSLLQSMLMNIVNNVLAIFIMYNFVVCQFYCLKCHHVYVQESVTMKIVGTLCKMRFYLQSERNQVK